MGKSIRQNKKNNLGIIKVKCRHCKEKREMKILKIYPENDFEVSSARLKCLTCNHEYTEWISEETWEELEIKKMEKEMGI